MALFNAYLCVPGSPALGAYKAQLQINMYKGLKKSSECYISQTN